LANRSAASCASVASSARHASSAASTSRFPTSRRNVSSEARSECARLCAVTGSFLPPNFFRVASATSAATNIARHAARDIGETAASTTATRSFRVDVGCAAHGVSARFVSTNRRHTVPAARRATWTHPSRDAATARLDHNIVVGMDGAATTARVGAPAPPPRSSPSSSYAATANAYATFGVRPPTVTNGTVPFAGNFTPQFGNSALCAPGATPDPNGLQKTANVAARGGGRPRTGERRRVRSGGTIDISVDETLRIEGDPGASVRGFEGFSGAKEAASVEAAFVEAETVEAASVEAKSVESSPLTTSPLTASSLGATPPLLGASLSLARSSSSPFKISAAARSKSAARSFLSGRSAAMDVYNTARSHGLSPAATASDASASAGFGGVVCARASRSASRRRSNAVVAPYIAVSAARRATLRRTPVTRRSARSRSVAFPTANARRYRAANASACRHANCRSVSDAREGENENVDDDAAPSPSPDDATDHTASHVTWRVDSPIERLLFHTAARRACAIAATASSATRSASRVSPRDSNKSKSRVATTARRWSSSCDTAANARWIPASARVTNAASSASPRTVVLDVSVNESFVRRQRSVAASATTSAHARAANVGVDDNASANAARGSAFFGAGGEESALTSFPFSFSESALTSFPFSFSEAASTSFPSSSSRLPRPSTSFTASKTSAATPSSSVPSSCAAPVAFACARRSSAVFARRSNKSQDSYPNARLRKPACAVGDSSATAA